MQLHPLDVIKYTFWKEKLIFATQLSERIFLQLQNRETGKKGLFQMMQHNFLWLHCYSLFFEELPQGGSEWPKNFHTSSGRFLSRWLLPSLFFPWNRILSSIWCPFQITQHPQCTNIRSGEKIADFHLRKQRNSCYVLTSKWKWLVRGEQASAEGGRPLQWRSLRSFAMFFTKFASYLRRRLLDFLGPSNIKISKLPHHHEHNREKLK